MNITEPKYTFFYFESDREEWRYEFLAEKWQEAYPNVFDDDDIRVLRTREQRRYHFYEWLSAIRLYEEGGYISLLETYLAKNHPRKRTTIKNLIPSSIFEWMDANKSGQPDLFVYHPVSLDWFFCEVKGPGDVVQENQKLWLSGFTDLMRREGLSLHNRVVLAKVVKTV